MFIASYAIPPVIAPSPITAIELRSSPCSSVPTAIPSAAEIDVDEWPAPNLSYSDSFRFAKPDSPPDLRSVCIRCRRPVRILCGYTWWLTSQMIGSAGALKT